MNWYVLYIVYKISKLFYLVRRKILIKFYLAMPQLFDSNYIWIAIAFSRCQKKIFQFFHTQTHTHTRMSYFVVGWLDGCVIFLIREFLLYALKSYDQWSEAEKNPLWILISYKERQKNASIYLFIHHSLLVYMPIIFSQPHSQYNMRWIFLAHFFACLKWDLYS